MNRAQAHSCIEYHKAKPHKFYKVFTYWLVFMLGCVTGGWVAFAFGVIWQKAQM